jgi:hypothetical protein
VEVEKNSRPAMGANLRVEHSMNCHATEPFNRPHFAQTNDFGE